MHCSKLNHHLHQLHVVDSPACTYGFNLEDNSHYLLECPLHVIARQTMIAEISRHLPRHDINENTLLFGLDNSIDDTKVIFLAVFKFISQTKRLY